MSLIFNHGIEALVIAVQSDIHIECVRAMQDKHKVQDADSIHRILSECVLFLEKSITHLEMWAIMNVEAQQNIKLITQIEA